MWIVECDVYCTDLYILIVLIGLSDCLSNYVYGGAGGGGRAEGLRGIKWLVGREERGV